MRQESKEDSHDGEEGEEGVSAAAVLAFLVTVAASGNEIWRVCKLVCVCVCVCCDRCACAYVVVRLCMRTAQEKFALVRVSMQHMATRLLFSPPFQKEQHEEGEHSKCTRQAQPISYLFPGIGLAGLQTDRVLRSLALLQRDNIGSMHARESGTCAPCKCARALNTCVCLCTRTLHRSNTLPCSASAQMVLGRHGP